VDLLGAACQYAEGVLLAMFIQTFKSLNLMLLILVACARAWADDSKAEPQSALPKVQVDRHGDPLPPGALERFGTIRLRHSDEVTSVAWSRDGKFIASLCRSQQFVTVWDPLTGKEVTRLRSHNSRIRGVSFSPDGKWLVSWGDDRIVSLQEMATLGKAESKPRQIPCEGPQPIVDLAFFPDGKFLVTSQLENGLHVWDVVTGKLVLEFGENRGRVGRIAVAPDGKTLAADHHHRAPDKYICTILLWDLATGKEIRQIGSDQTPIDSLAFSADGTILACGAQDGPSVWDVASGKSLLNLDKPRDVFHISSVAFTPNGKSLIAEVSGFLTEWSLTTGRVSRADPVAGGYVCSSAFSPDGKVMVTGGTRTIGIWDLPAAKSKFDLGGHQSRVDNVAFSRNGTELITADNNRTIIRWDLPAAKEIARFTPPGTTKGRTLLAQSPNNKKLVLQGDNLALMVVEAATGKERVRFLQHLPRNFSAYAFKGAVFTPDSYAVISFAWGADTNIRVWEADTGKEILVIPASTEESSDPRPAGIVLSPDGKTLYCTHLRAPVRVLDMVTGKEVRHFGVEQEDLSGMPTRSSDGRYLAYSTVKGIGVWDTATGKLLKELPHPRGYFPRIGFSPDGRVLAVSCDQQPLRLWEIASGQPRLEVSGHTGPVKSFAFSSDGRLLATGSDDTTALLWNLHALTLVKSPGVAELTPKILDTLWSDLFSDAPAAYKAVARLSGFPKETVAFLDGRLSPVEVKPPDKLFARLDDEDLDVRESASKELTALGTAAEPTIRKVLASTSSIEVRVRLEKILAQNRLGLLRALEVLESIGTPEAQKVVQGLAKGAELAELTVEARATLARMERKAQRE
jgi:WD40 repeat protein